MGKLITSKFSQPVKVVKRKSAKSLGKSGQHLEKILHMYMKQTKDCGDKSSIKDKHAKNTEQKQIDQKQEVEVAFQDVRVETFLNPCSKKRCLKLVKPISDIFDDDDFNASYEHFSKGNLIYTIFDEIALEGLDGITLEALWKRIQHSFKLANLPLNLKATVWSLICLNKDIKLFKLPTERDKLPLVIHRENHPRSPITFSDADYSALDIYKVEPAPKGTVFGSCSTYQSRVDVTESARKLPLNKIFDLYSNKLVVVASEDARKYALLGGLIDPNYELVQNEYCLLERIGRAREFGAITAGPLALTVGCGLDAKSIHHYCKKWSKEHLVVRQNCFLNSAVVGKTGRLLHLRRFSQVIKSKSHVLLENIVNLLKNSPDCTAPLEEVKELFDPLNSFKMLFKNQEYSKYFDMNIHKTYREYYKDATYDEYMVKSRAKERKILLMRLKDPYINISAALKDSQGADSSDEENEEKEEEGHLGGRRVYNKDFITDVFDYILTKGLEGAATVDLHNTFDADVSSLRVVLKRLVGRNLVTVKKCDLGRQTVNQYIARKLLENADYKPEDLHLVPSEKSCRVLEKLKLRQQQKAASLPKEKVYSREKMEADLEFLSIDSCPLTSFPAPQITFSGFRSKVLEPIKLPSITDIFISTPSTTFSPFTLTLKTPKISSVASLQLTTESINRINYTLSSNPGDVISFKFSPDHFTKAFLLRALLDNLDINEQRVINFLNPVKPTQKAEKRKTTEKDVPLPVKAQKADSQVSVLGFLLGSDPKVIHKEEDQNQDFVMEVQESRTEAELKMGDITQYVYDKSKITTERVLSRILAILRIIQEVEVFEEANRIAKIIVDEEAKSGYDKKIDRKSLHRIFKRLCSEGYIKLVYVTVRKEDFKKACWFICHPKVTLDHYKLKETINQLRERSLAYTKRILQNSVKAKVETKSRSPFVAEDVLQSLSEIQELTSLGAMQVPSRVNGKRLGQRPKFARLRLLHQFLFYLVYELTQNTTALPKEEVGRLFEQYKMKLTAAELADLPPVYSREISWKTFVPPLPLHHNWEDGWLLLVDVILRLPLLLISCIFAIRFTSDELQEVLQHPFKKFLLLRDQSPAIRTMVMHRRKFVADMIMRMLELCKCGLVQFGPSVFHDKEKSFFYLNRKACLWDTTSSASRGNLHIEEKEYPEIRFRFDNPGDVVEYWETMNRIAMQTRLGETRPGEAEARVTVDPSIKFSLQKAKAIRTHAEAKKLDNGSLPGDHKGAAGLDSSMWVHLGRNWNYFAPTNDIETLKSLKLDEVEKPTVPVKPLKPPSSKYFLTKQPTVQKKRKMGKSRPVQTKRTKQIIKFKWRNLGIDSAEDALDKATTWKFGGNRYRPHWSKSEDRFLVLFKMASVFITPGANCQKISYRLIRDLLHRVSPKSRDKTTRTVINRLRSLMKNLPILSDIEDLISNLYKLPLVKKYFVPFRRLMAQGQRNDSDPKVTIREQELQSAFVFISSYFITHQKEVELALHGRYSHLDFFSESNRGAYASIIQPYEEKLRVYENPSNLAEVTRDTLLSTVVCALSQKGGTSEWTFQTYKILQQFKEEDLRAILLKMGVHRMVQRRKVPSKIFFAPYRLSMYYIFSQSCAFYFDTMEEAYECVKKAQQNAEELDFSDYAIMEKKYGQLMGLNEMLSLILNETTLHFSFPQYHLVLNPDINDHSEVIDELARRYQAKLKNEAKSGEPQPAKNSSIQDDEEDELQVPEDVPKPPEETEPEIVSLDDDEPLDLSITAKDNPTIDNLKHWISECIDAARVRSPSPELLTLEIKKEPDDFEIEINGDEENNVNVRGVRILTLDEIKVEMLKPDDDSGERLVPYISNLTKLLTETFDEVESDDGASYLMKKHFVQKYPALESLISSSSSNNQYVASLEAQNFQEVRERVEKDMLIGLPDQGAAADEILRNGGSVEDISMADAIVSYIKDKGVCGVSGCELKRNFSDDVCSILRILTRHKVILGTGICSPVFVHHNYQSSWLMNTFKVTSRVDLALDTPIVLDTSQNIDISQWYKARPFPWIHLDGNLDKDKFKLWLSQVFSYCIENPKVPFLTVCDKFCYMRPMDVFYLLEVLEEIGAVEVRRLIIMEVDLFSQYEVEDCKGTMLDRFEDLYVQTNNVSFTKLGSFFNKL
ncbi:general transcription factor 3C polypeptide 1 [Euwallacea similis]|uniref:general transcription factor 3C polypeptide 1 n=1 Tax=Euwallacea similis TaxID=1736056 RepID=UPI00344B50ED